MCDDVDLPPPPPGYEPVRSQQPPPVAAASAVRREQPTALAAVAVSTGACDPVSFSASPNFRPPPGSTGPPPAGGAKAAAPAAAAATLPSPRAAAPQPPVVLKSAAKRFVADEHDLPPPPLPPATTASHAAKVSAPAAPGTPAPVALAPAPAPAPAAHSVRSPSLGDVPPPPPPPPTEDAIPPPPPELSPLQEELLSAAFKGKAGLKHVSEPTGAQTAATPHIVAPKQPTPSPPLPAPAPAPASAPASARAAAAGPVVSAAGGSACASASSSPPVCAGCHLVISGSVVELGDGSSFHPACLLCVRCGHPIRDAAVLSLPHVGVCHEACVVCAACGKNVAQEGFATNASTGHIFCAAHAKQAKNTAATPASSDEATATASVCAGCRAPLHSAGPSVPLVSTGGAVFHAECLQCCECQCSLAASSGPAAYEQSGRHYCARDFQRLFGRTCAACDKPITAGAIMAVESGTQRGTMHFHDACFVCSQTHCRAKLAPGQFCMQADGKLVCERC